MFSSRCHSAARYTFCSWLPLNYLWDNSRESGSKISSGGFSACIQPHLTQKQESIQVKIIYSGKNKESIQVKIKQLAVKQVSIDISSVKYRGIIHTLEYTIANCVFKTTAWMFVKNQLLRQFFPMINVWDLRTHLSLIISMWDKLNGSFVLANYGLGP